MWLILISTFGSLGAQTGILLNDQTEEKVFTLSKLPYFEDTTNALGFEEVSKRGFQQYFTPNPSYSTKDFNRHATYWLKVPVRYMTSSKKNWILEFYDQRIDEITAFLPKEDGQYAIQKVGDRFPFVERNIKHKNFEFILENEVAWEEEVYFFRIRCEGPADIRLAIRSVNRFVQRATNEYFLFGIFYGMVLIICLYNFLMYAAIREKKYLYYIFYLLSVAVYVLCIDGIAFQYIWPEWVEWNQYAYGVATYFLIIWVLLFTKKFLGTASRAPVYHRLINWIIVLRTLYFIGALLYDHSWFEYGVLEGIPLIIILLASIHVYVKGFKPARFVVAAYGVLFIGFVLKVFTDTGLLPFSTVLHYSLRLSFLVEMLLLSFALGDKVRILKDKKDRAQRRIIQEQQQNMMLKEKINQELQEKVVLKEKVNKELEQKVKERTLELYQKNAQLEESNQKLLDQAREINHINCMLDKANWKLKNTVKKELNDRLLNKNLEYLEFQDLFQNEKACYRYMEELKGKQAFSCRKCGNEKCTESNKVYARRCTRCGKSESATAYTLFHGIKFPIEKAFYIAYITIHDHSHFTLDELSELLDIRRNTVWGFKQKVQTVKDFLQHRKKTKHIHWEEIVLTHPGTVKKVSKAVVAQS